MNDLIMLILAINLFASLIVFFMIMNDNNFHFIKWAKHSFEIRNWFGKIQICLLIVWMMPIIIICAVSFPVAWILANIFVGIIFGCNKIIELGKNNIRIKKEYKYMTLEILQVEMITAMKNKDKIRKDTLSSLIAAVKKTAIDERCKENITEELVNKVILKEQKTVQEMIDTCPDTRTDLLQEYTARLAVVEEFAPKLISDEKELSDMILKVLSKYQIEPLKSNKGTVMKTVMPELKGKADMKVANKVIGELLN